MSKLLRIRLSGTRSGSLDRQYSGQPRSFCGQKPWTMNEYGLRPSHCAVRPPASWDAHQLGDQDSDRT